MTIVGIWFWHLWFWLRPYVVALIDRVPYDDYLALQRLTRTVSRVEPRRQ